MLELLLVVYCVCGDSLGQQGLIMITMSLQTECICDVHVHCTINYGG